MSHSKTMYCFNSSNKAWIRFPPMTRSGQMYPADSRTVWDGAEAISASEVPSTINHHPLEGKRRGLTSLYPDLQTLCLIKGGPHYKSLRLFLPFCFFGGGQWSSKRYALKIKDKTTDEVCYFISLRNAELLCLQDTIKAEAHQRPIRVSSANTEQRSKTRLHYMTATRIESNWIPLLVWAHPLTGLCIKGSIIIARMVLVSVGVSWPISRITEARSRFLFFLFFDNTLYYDYYHYHWWIAEVELQLSLWTLPLHWKSQQILQKRFAIAVTPPVPSNPDTHYLMDEANFVKSLQWCAREWCKTQESKI